MLEARTRCVEGREQSGHHILCLGLALHVHGGVNGGERSQEGVEVGLADGHR